jgi:hypothetical protein
MPAAPWDVTSIFTDIIADPQLSCAAKLAARHLLIRPASIVTRDELAGIHPSVAEHLDEVLHQLDRYGLLATVPAGHRPCTASQFQLRQDRDSEADQLDAWAFNVPPLGQPEHHTL